MSASISDKESVASRIGSMRDRLSKVKTDAACNFDRCAAKLSAYAAVDQLSFSSPASDSLRNRLKTLQIAVKEANPNYNSQPTGISPRIRNTTIA